MSFKIVSVGWNCAEWIENTLRSVEEQSISDWVMWITYDPSDDNGAQVIKNWCDKRDGRWNYKINGDRKFAVRNQFEAITNLDPKDEDIIVFLDLDGDRLAHPDVLRQLRDHYSDETLVTYGNYEPVPYNGPRLPVTEFPPHVVASNSYRQHTLMGGCCFNHLRTMKGKVFRAIPVEQFKWESGEWYQIGTDYVFMMAALELAGGRYKCINETLLLYNHANPYADNIPYEGSGVSCVLNCLNRPPLPPLEVGPVVPEQLPEPPTGKPVGRDEWFLPAEERREILRQYGKQFGLRMFIETGTNTGLTPLALRDSFDHLYTIELSETLWAAAVQMFLNTPKVECLFGNSADVLPQILAKIDEPALIWLDGHYSGPGTAHGPTSTPIRQELSILFEDRRKHVILVDDARIFEGGPEHEMYDHYLTYPSLEWVEQLATRYGYNYFLEDDIIRLTPS